VHEVVQLLLDQQELRIESAILTAVLLDFLLDFLGAFFEVIDVIEVDTNSKG